MFLNESHELSQGLVDLRLEIFTGTQAAPQESRPVSRVRSGDRELMVSSFSSASGAGQEPAGSRAVVCGLQCKLLSIRGGVLSQGLGFPTRRTPQTISRWPG